METGPRVGWNGEKVLLQYELLPSPWERYSARLIDQIVMSLLAAAFLVPGYVYEVDALILLGFAVLIGGSAIYESVCLGWRGQTLGKNIKGLRVLNVTDGKPPKRMQALFRWVVLHTFPFAYWSVWSTRNHRGSHDRLARTVVVYANRTPQDY